MCPRYFSPDQADIEHAWHIGRHNQPNWAKKVFPRSPGPFLWLGQNGSSVDLVVGIWALIPKWSEMPRSEILDMQLPIGRGCSQADIPRRPAEQQALHHPGAVVRNAMLERRKMMKQEWANFLDTSKSK